MVEPNLEFMEKKNRSAISLDQPKESDDTIWDCGSRLYDSYELASIGHALERHTMVLPYPCSRSMRFRIIPSKQPNLAEGRFEGKMANLHGVGFFRKVVTRWAFWRMRNTHVGRRNSTISFTSTRSRNDNEMD